MKNAQTYEILFITRPTEEAKKAVVDKVKAFVASVGGQVEREYYAGLQRLAWDVDGYKEGHYMNWDIIIPRPKLTSLLKALNGKNVLRRIIIMKGE